MLEANIYERFVDVKDNILVISNFNLSTLNNDWEKIKKRSATFRKISRICCSIREKTWIRMM